MGPSLSRAVGGGSHSLTKPARAFAGLALMVLVVTPFLAAGSPPGSGAPQATAADHSVATPTVRILDLNWTRPVLAGSTDQRQPELFLSPTGDMVISYLSATQPYVTSLNATSLQEVLAPTRISAETQVGNEYPMFKLADIYLQNYAALDSQGRLTRAFSKSGLPVAFATRVDPDGSISLSEAYLGGVRPSAIGSFAIAVGPNDSIVSVRSDGYDSTQNTELLFSKIAANGTPVLGNVSLYNDGQKNVKPRIAWDGAHSRFILTWGNQAGTVRLLTFDENGSVIWGPVTLGSIGDHRSAAILPDGSIAVVWAVATSGELRASRVSASGSVSVSARTILSGLSSPQQPFAVAGPENELVVMFADVGTQSEEIYVTGFDADTLKQNLNVIALADDAYASTEPYARIGPNGELWVAWVSNTSTFNPGDIMLSQVRLRHSSVELQTPMAEVNVTRAEISTIDVTVRNNGTGLVPLLLNSGFASLGGPANWSVVGTDDTGAPFPSQIEIPGGASAVFHFRIDPPVVDPPGYMGVLTVGATDTGWPRTSANISVVVRVTPGHRVEVSPAFANATALPGAQASVPFLVINPGAFNETGMPVVLRSGPPPGWSVSLSLLNLSLLAGAQQPLWVNVTPPADASWKERYCDVFSISTAVDPFARASGGFCVEVGLVVSPFLRPSQDTIEIPPGGSASVVLSLTNVGNAREPVECRLDTVQAFPAGWYSMGLPAVIPLEGGETGEVQVDFLAPTGALGNERVDVVVEAACPEGGSTGRANFSLVVEAVHAVKWAVQGDALQANETGWATFAVTIENLGNVPEPFSWQPLEFPMGWSVSAIPAGMDPSAAVFPAFSTASVRVEIHAGESSLAGTYIVDISLVAGQELPFRRTFHVTLPVRHDLTGRFSASSSVVGPGEDLTITGEVANPGNADDTYSLAASTDGARVWGWKAEFVGGEGSGQLEGTQLSLKAFGRGTLTVTFTVPGSPFPGLVEVSVGLSSPRVATVGASFSVAVELSDLLAQWASIPNGTANPTLSGNARLHVEFFGMRAPATVAVEVFLDGHRVWNDSLHVPAGTGVLNVSVPLVLGAGEHRLEARVDPRDGPGGDPRWGVLFESDETNNDAVAALAIGSPPTSPGGGDERPPAENAAIGGATFVLASILGGVVAAAVGIVVWRRRGGRRRAGDGGTLQHHAEVGDEKDPTRRD